MRVLLSILLLVLLAVASVAAVFALAKIERQPPVIGRPVVTRAFSPNDDGKIDAAKVSINVPRADRVDVKIVDEDERVVAKLATNQRVRGKESWTWDGQADVGTPADEGAYRMQVRLRDRGRTVLVPTTIALDLTPPKIHSLEADDSRAKIRVVRVNASVSGASEYRIQTVIGSAATVFETIRFRRSSEERSNPGDRDDFRLSVRVPSELTLPEQDGIRSYDPKSEPRLEFVATDEAGNETTRSFDFPLFIALRPSDGATATATVTAR